jgi:hypothetical protein
MQSGEMVMFFYFFYFMGNIYCHLTTLNKKCTLIC